MVELQQRFGHVGLVGEDIEGGAGDPPLDQRRHQGRLIDHRPASDVDEIALGAQRVQNLRRHHRPRLGAAGKAEGQHVRGAGHVDEAVIVAVAHVRLGPTTVIDHLHAQQLGTAREGPADATQAENPQRLVPSAAGERHGAFADPSAIAHPAVTGGDLTQQRQHQHEAHVGDLVGEHVGGVGDRHAALPAGGVVDRVGADAEAADDLERRAALDQRAGGATLAGRDDRPHLRSHLGDELVRIGRLVEVMDGVGRLELGHLVRPVRPDDEHIGPHVPFSRNVCRAVYATTQGIGKVSTPEKPPSRAGTSRGDARRGPEWLHLSAATGAWCQSTSI